MKWSTAYVRNHVRRLYIVNCFNSKYWLLYSFFYCKNNLKKMFNIDEEKIEGALSRTRSFVFGRARKPRMLI